MDFAFLPKKNLFFRISSGLYYLKFLTCNFPFWTYRISCRTHLKFIGINISRPDFKFKWDSFFFTVVGLLLFSTSRIYLLMRFNELLSLCIWLLDFDVTKLLLSKQWGWWSQAYTWLSCCASMKMNILAQNLWTDAEKLHKSHTIVWCQTMLLLLHCYCFDVSWHNIREYSSERSTFLPLLF